jgi:hypothetical protein
MNFSDYTRIVVAPVRRQSWYRGWNWAPIGLLMGVIAFWAFIIWCAAKAVR